MKECIIEVKKKLLDIVRDKIRFKHYSISTEKTYVHWVTHYILFHDKKHPKDMGKRDIEKFLTHLAMERKVSPSTQNQAFSAILFLYKEVLDIDMSEVLNLRIKDVDMGFDKVYIWDSKSLKDRIVPLSLKLKNRLLVQIEYSTKILHRL